MDSEALPPKYSLSYRKRPFGGDTNARTIPELLRHWARTNPDGEAFVFVTPDKIREAITWSDLYDRSVKFARSLVTLGVNRGDVVGIAVRNSPMWLYATFGSMFAGAIPIPIALTYSDGSDVMAILNAISSCTTFILDPDVEESAWGIVKGFLTSFEKSGSVESSKIPTLKYLVCTCLPGNETGVLTMETLLKMADEDIELPVMGLDDFCMLSQTSGSTGLPKPVIHTYRSVYFLSVITRTVYEKSHIRWYDDRPLGYMGGWPLTVITGETRVCLRTKAKLPDDLATLTLDIIRQERCNCLYVLAPGLQQLMDNVDAAGDDVPLNTLCVAGQPIRKQFATCIGKLCRRFVCAYGSTEYNAGLINVAYDPEEFADYAAGTPTEGAEVKVVNDDGETVPVNIRGEIYVKHLGMFAGYFNSAEKTKAVFTEDGWFKSDDIGHMTEDGCFYAEGRKSDVIISGGMNVYPSALESLIKSCPGVHSVAIVGIPDDVFFQVLCACVIRQPGTDVTADNLRKFCEAMHNDRPRLFTVLPTHYLFFDSFPLTRTGKTSRKNLTADAIRRIKE